MTALEIMAFMFGSYFSGMGMALIVGVVAVFTSYLKN